MLRLLFKSGLVIGQVEMLRLLFKS